MIGAAVAACGADGESGGRSPRRREVNYRELGHSERRNRSRA